MALDIFHPIIKQWFAEEMGTPTEVQIQAWPLIQQGQHVLVTAPTGCGKTLTAFLWAIHQLVSGTWQGGQTRVLYISPLKALNNDIQRNLLTPLEQLRERFMEQGLIMPDIQVLTRSGDTPAGERRKMQRRSPEILITTPESLNILLTSAGYHPMLTGIQTVILDEIHAVLDSKRGTHLISAVDRLVLLAGEFQRLALSATVKPLDRVARFVGGYQQTVPATYVPRSVAIVSTAQAKTYDCQVDFPDQARSKLVEGSWWPVLTERFRQHVTENQSTLFFANSRRLVEKVARLINEDQDEALVYAHHGSLSKEIRLAVEQRLKDGRLRGMVATSSLELGIDIGGLDEVILIQTPFSVASTIQRLGRAGHQVGAVSRGRLYPTHGGDFLMAAVMSRAVTEGDIEPVTPITGALDVLTQVILSMTVTRRWDIDELFAFLKTSTPFHEVTQTQFDLVLQMLEGRYADTRIRELKPRVTIDRIDNTIKAKASVAFLLYMAGGTIPDRGYYDLRLQDTRAKIGELDEEFVWERRVGETFALGNQIWRIQHITHNDVEVTPATRQLNIIPFWKADEQDAPYHFSTKVGAFLEWAEAHLEDADFQTRLIKDYAMVPSAAAELIAYLQRQRLATGVTLPHQHHLLIEEVQDSTRQQDAQQIILHTFWGGRVNRPLALALSMAWQQSTGQPLQVFVNNNAILLLLPMDASVKTVLDLVTPEKVEGLLTLKLEQTGYFGAHFRENAGRALLLPKQNFKKRMPLWLNRLRAKKLLQTIQGFDDFPILLETWRCCLQDEFDLPQVQACLERLQTREIQITTVATHYASPFADGLIWRQTNQHMYEDDTPLVANKTSLKTELIRDLLFASHLRPQIPRALIEELEAKRQRRYPGYAPDNLEELVAHVKERLAIPEREWGTLLQAMNRDSDPTEVKTWLNHVAPKLARLTWPGSDISLIMARETLPRLQALFAERMGFGVTAFQSQHKIEIPNWKDNALEAEGHADLAPWLGQWLSFYGPLTSQQLSERLGLSKRIWQPVVEDLLHNEQVILDHLSEDATEPEICDVTNLEILLRLLRRSRRPGFAARSVQSLSTFLATFQGLARPGDGPEDLQRILNRLFGLALAPGLWEEVVFPSRLRPYLSSWLDGLVQEHGLVLQGHDDKKLSFSFMEDLELFGDGKKDKPALDETLGLSPTGRYSLLDLTEQSARSSAELTKALWQAFWSGQVSVDAFGVLRKAMASKFKVQATSQSSNHQRLGRRSGFRRWQADRPMAGHWYLLPPVEDTDDPIAAEECQKDRVRQLLNRYGLLFRELLQREVPVLQWRSLLRSLRLMEFSGEVITGQFFTGIPGLQFMSHEAFELFQRGSDNEAIYWINACDPVSLCGVGIIDLKAELPSRLPTNYMVYHGDQVVLVVQKNGKALHFYVDPGHPRLSDYFQLFKDLLNRDFSPLKKVIVETINDQPVGQSLYLSDLLQFGFEKNANRVELWKRYH